MHRSNDIQATFSSLYPEVRKIASRCLRRGGPPWRGDQTLDTTALTHEAYMKLYTSRSAAWNSRGHFLAMVAQAMRYVLVDYARLRTRQKRGSGQRPVPLEEAKLMSASLADEVLALDQALEGLGRLKPRLARVVECRFILGLSLEETAEAVGVSTMTVKRDWLSARGFLARVLSAPPIGQADEAADVDE